jgi:RimJ/RimL family protein N-acetyltransferase
MAFELQPRLVGTGIELRPLAPDDFETLLAVARDPLIWEQHPEPDRCERQVFRRYFDGGIESGGAFAIIDRTTGAVIGSSRYCNLDPAGRQVEIGWTFLARAFWGGACNRELKSLMLDHAFRFVDRVVFVVGEHNLRSQRALEKIGARPLPEGPAGAPGARATDRVFVITRADRDPAIPDTS